MPTRRDLLKIVAAVPAAASAQHPHTSEKFVQIAKPLAPKAFDKARFQTLTRLVDLIIPRTETPGAADAGVDFASRRPTKSALRPEKSGRSPQTGRRKTTATSP